MEVERLRSRERLLILAYYIPRLSATEKAVWQNIGADRILQGVFVFAAS